MFFKKNKKSDPAKVYADAIKQQKARSVQISNSVRNVNNVNEQMLKGLAQLMR